MNTKLSWVTHEGNDYPIAYDTTQEILVLDFFNYAFHLYSRRRLSSTYVKNEFYHLVVFYNHLTDHQKIFLDSSDYILRKFRDSEFKRMQLKSRSSTNSLKTVINNKLIRIYHFLCWIQHYYSVEGLIGIDKCQVSSSLTLDRHQDSNSSTDYPLLFRIKGARSKHLSRYSPNANETEKLSDYFLHNFSTYLAQRNILIMEIAIQIGLRRASINSLRCTQFSNAVIEALEDDKLGVVPDSQKFNYRISYEFPFSLALRINTFIHGPRQALIQQLGVFENITQDRLFISSRSAAPLSDRSISSIFSQAFDQIGIDEARISLHSLRRTFTKSEIRRQILGRIENKLDTSDESINAALAMRLGQSDPSSTEPYVSSTQLEIIEEGAASKSAEISALKQEVARLNSIILKLSE